MNLENAIHEMNLFCFTLYFNSYLGNAIHEIDLFYIAIVFFVFYRCSYATRCSSLWHLAEWFAHRDAAVQILPASSARLFAKALVYCSSSCFDSEEGRNNFSSLVSA